MSNEAIIYKSITILKLVFVLNRPMVVLNVKKLKIV